MSEPGSSSKPPSGESGPRPPDAPAPAPEGTPKRGPDSDAITAPVVPALPRIGPPPKVGGGAGSRLFAPPPRPVAPAGGPSPGPTGEPKAPPPGAGGAPTTPAAESEALAAPAGAEPEPEPEPEEATERAPVRLPSPGAWGQQAPRDAVIDFARREDAGAFVSPPSPAEAEAAPDSVGPQDTQALIASMADEIEEEAEAQRAAQEAEKERQEKERRLLEQPTLIYQPVSEGRRGIGGWLGVAAAGLLGIVLIVWSLGDDDGAPSDETAPANAGQVAQAKRPAGAPAPVPTPSKTEPAAEAPVAEPAPEAVEPTEEAAPGTTGAADEPAPAPPAAAPSPRPKKKKGSSGEAASTEAPPAEKTASASKPSGGSSGGGSGKSAEELLAEAKKANVTGPASKAHSLASQSYQKKASSDAAEQMVIAACKMRDEAKARSAFQRVKLLKRRDLKTRCKSQGISL